MKKAFLFAFALFFIITAFAQKRPVIKFDSNTHDFGTIKEENGKVEGTFNFTNSGDDTLKIIKVKPGCGCTASDYTNTPIPPKGTGFIKAIFNPTGYNGSFQKAMVVTINDSLQPRSVLFIKGNVIPKEKTFLDLYPQKIGNLRLSSNYITFNDIKTDEKRQDTIRLYNEWNKPMSFQFIGLPAFVQCKAEPSTLKPSEKGLLIISYDAKIRNDIGWIIDRFSFASNDSIEINKNLVISAKIVEDFSKLTAKQLTDAPIIEFVNKDFDFATVKQDTQVKHRYEFINKGKSDLIIRKITASCGCTTATIANKVIKKGEKSAIEVVFNTTGRKGKQQKNISLITNDPKNSNIELIIQGNIE